MGLPINQTSSNANFGQGNPFFCLNHSVSGGRTAWPEFVLLASEAGYAGADFTSADLERVGVEAAIELLAQCGVMAGFGKLPVECRLDQTLFEEGFQSLERQASEAKRIGCHAMGCSLFPSADVPFDDYYKIQLTRFRRCAEVLEANGLKLAVEFVSPLHTRRKRAHEFIWNLPQTMRFVNDCGNNAGILLDAWHWHHSNGTVAQILSAKDHILHVHLADSADVAPEEVDDMERLLPGEGVVRWKEFFGALLSINFDGGMSPEVFGTRFKGLSPEACAMLTMEKCKWIWANY